MLPNPVLVPLVMLCNAAPLSRSHLPVLFRKDLAFVSLVATLSISNGYLGGLCMTHSPKMQTRQAERSAAAVVTNLAVVAGIATGSGITGVLANLI